ncbi:MAG TPA: SGNH family hydrolase [Bosea sp. (in: a-proteobacteria)]
MRLRSLLMLLAAAGLLLLTGGPTSFAQQYRQQPQQQRNFFQWFWQQPQQPAAVQPQRQRVAPVARRRPAAPVVVRDDPVIPKVDVAHHILVIGDSLAHLLADGLEEALEDRPDLAVVQKAKPDSGLVRNDFYDWPKVAADLLAGDQKTSLGVMMIGLNDRQAIREGDTVHEPLSPRWLELYRERINAVTQVFAARRVPLIWVGAPPVQNARLSTDLVTFNEQYRQQVERTGGQYVDLWGAFVDAENRYATMGPDVSGQTMRLRLGDGIHFTAAGARKAAHFVDVLVRRMFEPGAQGDVIALPVSPDTGAPSNPELQPGGVERLIDQMVSGLPSISLPAALQAKPLAGPILPLTGSAVPGDQALLISIPDARGRGEIASQLDRIFGEGVLPEPKPGRIDDHRWPR